VHFVSRLDQVLPLVLAEPSGALASDRDDPAASGDPAFP
jgi:hypothetical protein